MPNPGEEQEPLDVETVEEPGPYQNVDPANAQAMKDLEEFFATASQPAEVLAMLGGATSLCWTEKPTGTFRAELANHLCGLASKRIEELYAANIAEAVAQIKYNHERGQALDTPLPDKAEPKPIRKHKIRVLEYEDATGGSMNSEPKRWRCVVCKEENPTPGTVCSGN